MNDYEKQAHDFLVATGCTIEKKFLKCDKYFDDDKEDRNIREITLKRGYDSYTFTYGDSIVNTQSQKKPTDYDILACLDVVYEDNFEDWCSSYGYDVDSRKAEKIYHACLEQDRGLRRLFDRKELEMLQEIN